MTAAVITNSNHLKLLDRFEEASVSSTELALLRMEYLDNASNLSKGTTDDEGVGAGLANELNDLLQNAIDAWADGSTATETQPTDNSNNSLPQILTILRNVTEYDLTLTEEVARCHGFNERMLELQDLNTTDRNLELAQQIQDSCAQYSTEGLLPYSKIELQNRLPLMFRLPRDVDLQQHDVIDDGDDTPSTLPEQTILVHQVSSTDDGGEDEADNEDHNVGFVMWPSAVMLARWISQNPAVILDRDVPGDILELGAGCGLVGLAAATLPRYHPNHEYCTNKDDDAVNKANTKIIFTDYLPTVLENLGRNVRLNDVENCTSVFGLDFWDQSNHDNDSENIDSNQRNFWTDMEGIRHPQVSLILAADVICYSNDAELLANTIQAALLEGGQAIIIGADENQRFGIREFPDACREVGLEVSVRRIVADGSSNIIGNKGSSSSSTEQPVNLVQDLEQTSGYKEGYVFTMFTVKKNPAAK